MTLPTSGAISLENIQTEFGGSNPIGMNEYYRDGAYVTSNNTNVPTSGTISLQDFYGASGVVTEGPEYYYGSPVENLRLFARIYIEFTGKILDYYYWGTTSGSVGYIYPNEAGAFFNTTLTSFNYGTGATVSGGWYHFVKNPPTSYIESDGPLEDGVFFVDFKIWRSTSSTYPF